MSDCERFHPTIEAFVAGDLDDSALGPLLTHCRSCEECRDLLSLHRDLVELASEVPEPSEGAFDRLQGRVLDEVAGVRRPRMALAADHPSAFRSWRFPPGWALASGLAAALLLWIAGFAAGRRPVDATRARVSASTTAIDRVVQQIAAAAVARRDHTAVGDSGLTFSNVAYRPMDDGRVALSFDVTTHVQFVEPLSSDLVHEVLVQSLLNPSSTGARLRALAYAADVRERHITDALIFAIRHDDNLAVRLEALRILGDRLHEPEVEAALLETLRGDAAVQMRLMALDRLAGHRVDRERLRETIGDGKAGPGDAALRVRLASYEHL